jgi:hypothetical protein
MKSTTVYLNNLESTKVDGRIGNRDLRDTLILTNRVVNARSARRFQDAAAIFARTILTAINKMIVVEMVDNVDVSSEFIKKERSLFLLPTV